MLNKHSQETVIYTIVDRGCTKSLNKRKVSLVIHVLYVCTDLFINPLVDELLRVVSVSSLPVQSQRKRPELQEGHSSADRERRTLNPSSSENPDTCSVDRRARVRRTPAGRSASTAAVYDRGCYARGMRLMVGSQRRRDRVVYIGRYAIAVAVKSIASTFY